ncbi:MAG TPA: universal stress protein [Acidobacteriaceae bacterium]|jgi:nucleotide-binding universal stress UspA family protein
MTPAVEFDSIHVPAKQGAMSFKRIVVGLDYDESGRQVLQVASQMAAVFGSKVYLVHAFLPPPPADDLQVIPGDYLQRSNAEASHHVQSAIAGASPSIDAKTWNISACIDDPAELVLKTARDQQADLILLGSHGRRGLRNLLLGSTAETILSRAECPVMVLGPEYEPQGAGWPTVLFATDLEKTGIRAAEYASAIAARHHGSLLLLHVVSRKPRADGETREWVEDHIRETLCRLLSPLALQRCRHEAIVAYGDPAQEILAAADMKRADLIVLGAGDHKVMADHPPWRTVAHVIASARCPVLNVPAISR